MQLEEAKTNQQISHSVNDCVGTCAHILAVIDAVAQVTVEPYDGKPVNFRVRDHVVELGRQHSRDVVLAIGQSESGMKKKRKYVG